MQRSEKSRTNCYLSQKLWHFGKAKGTSLIGSVEIWKELCKLLEQSTVFSTNQQTEIQINQEAQRPHLIAEDNPRVAPAMLRHQQATWCFCYNLGFYWCIAWLYWNIYTQSEEFSWALMPESLLILQPGFYLSSRPMSASVRNMQRYVRI